MPDETTDKQVTAPEAAPPKKAAVKAVAAPAPPALDDEALWSMWDARVRAKPELRDRLKTHDIVAGIAGQIGETLYERRHADDERTTGERVARAKEEALLRMAEEDPEGFAAQFKTEKQAELARRELEQLRVEERKSLADRIGRAITDLPEWRTLTHEDFGVLAKGMAGVPADGVEGAFIRAATDIIAHKRAAGLAEASVAQRVKEEVEADRVARTASRIKSTPAPDVRPAQQGGTSDPEPDWRDSKAHDAWYTRHVLGRRSA